MFKKKEKKEKLTNNNSLLKEIFSIIIIAFAFRSLVMEPFHIPSGSMKPNLLIHDYIFVSKFSYGYSRYSFPFGLKLFSGRIFDIKPKRGDVAVFRLPSDTSINYIKRIIGLPGDNIIMKNGQLFINEIAVPKEEDGYFSDYNIKGDSFNIKKFIEILPNNKKIKTIDMGDSPFDNTSKYIVPENHYFVMGDNRDGSQDSRFRTKVGFIPSENLVGKAKIIFFSAKYPFLNWKWPFHIRFNRIFKLIK